jgi:hypothetical protein
MPFWLRHFLDAARADSTKSSALAPLQWLIAICFAGAIGLGFSTGSVWIGGAMALLPCLLCVFYCYEYEKTRQTNPDALRSERYSLNKIAMEKGLIGDDRIGLLEPPIVNESAKDNSVPQIPPYSLTDKKDSEEAK